MSLYALDDRMPEVHDTAWIAPGCHVIGSVVLAEESSVWFGSTLRGDNEPILVGPRSNIQENAVLHTDPGFPLTIGADCTIGHKALLHGCTIGDGCLIGMAATVMNGAVIGAGSLVGAGALVTEGTEVPPGSLVLGAPGRVKRELDEAAIAGLIASARHYVENARRFRNGLRPL
ncbi:gamma carbonic anhydrase family protein [Pelagovum pacificum]|uniref:Gamma carbonic anhydrase family protein n=1 Tax=Pelagovum pacificum TaxID=2588711 RepID=A0A5C5GD99_9RHOB|nr:gamma carbonic anhydrase family protein [Pelagovum pacificum]QQA44758.1 gamma carbonic anhydrase family protein [Pelagovum pacificum]TNY32134.1 gamma carbonic anhydrase family protein [Pelagovum pacificum]